MYNTWASIIKPTRCEFDEETLTSTYGRLFVEPLDRGYGITLGNAMRRVLLSSLPGAAVTSVKIEGVDYEFTTIPGVKEDVTHIILNVKELLFKSYTDEDRTLVVEKRGPGEVRASDIESPPDIEVLNPDLLIATLDSDEVEFRMEMKVSRGTGYLPVEKMEHRGLPVGTILVDAAFSPVRKVNFRVENARVGRETDYDRLILDVWTTGAVHPKDAVSVAATILKDHMGLFSVFEEEPQVVSPVSAEKDEAVDEKESILERSIDELGLTVRSHNCLKRMNINTIGDLIKKKESDLLKVRNFGKKSLQEVQEVLAKFGLTLGMDSGEEVAEAQEE